MQPIRRVYMRRSWSWVARRLFQLWNSNPFWFFLFLCVILSYESQEAYLQLAQELRPDNPQCSSSRTCLHLQIPLHFALLGSMLTMFMLVLIEWYDTAVPWISGCCAGFQVGLVIAYVILTVNWWNTAVTEEMDEQPAQRELENI